MENNDRQPDTLKTFGGLRGIILALAVLPLLAVLISGAINYVVLKKHALKELDQVSAESNRVANIRLSASLQDHQMAVALLAELPVVRQALARPEPGNLEAVNRLLDQGRRSLNADVCYLMDSKGLTIAASNRHLPASFVGKNYRFRPYFRSAIAGEPAIYMAVGITSGQRGLYYSHPVHDAGGVPEGVLVVKLPPDHIEEALYTGTEEVDSVNMVASPEGIVLMSGRAAWRLGALWPLAPETKAELVRAKQFGKGPWPWSGMTRMGPERATDASGRDYVVFETPLASVPGLRVISLRKVDDVIEAITNPLKVSVFWVVAGMTPLILLTIFFLYSAAQKELARRHRMQAALSESELRLARILETVHAGIAIIDPVDHTFISLNPAAERMAGAAPGELIGQVCYKSICPSERNHCPITDDNKMVDHRECALLRQDGSELPIIRTVTSFDIGNRPHLLETFIDISEVTAARAALEREHSALKAAESAAQESNKKLNTVMDTIVDPLAVYDNQGRATYTNPAFTRVFGWRYEELTGRRIAFVPEESMAETSTAVAKVLNGERVTGFETIRKTKEGRTINVRIGAALLQDTAGQSQGMVVNFQDITQEKLAQEELQRVNLDLQQSMEQAHIMAEKAESANIAKSEFLANMSHEIRTPMNGIIGMIELMMSTRLTSTQQNFLGVIQRSGDALLTIINDILDLSKIEAGHMELECIHFDLRATLEGVAESLAPKAAEKQIELIGNVRGGVPTHLMGDPGKLRQILLNLGGNAIKFTDTGEVELSCRVARYLEDAVRLHIAVRDTGIGIPPEKQALVFESFRQADGSTTRHYGGTGLGLSISRQLVQLMGGRLKLESAVGQGSTFYFEIDLPIAVLPAVAAAPPPATFQDVRALIVDDNATNRQVLAGMAGHWGLTVDEAPDADRGLVMIKQAAVDNTPYDLLLLDMNMPGKSGFDVVEQLGSRSAGAQPRVILLTSAGQQGDAARCQRLGIDAYLMKPIRQADLRESIEMVLGSDRDRARPATPQALVTRHTLRENRLGGRLKVLLAEDDPINQLVAVNMLKRLGHTVTIAGNGQIALDHLREGPFDLVLMDVQMPVMDGFTAVAEIRKREADTGRHTPVIAMTAHALTGDRERCLAAGMDDYLSKPIRAGALAEKLSAWSPDAVDSDGGRSASNAAGTAEQAAADHAVPDAAGTQEQARQPVDMELAMEQVMGNSALLRDLLTAFSGSVHDQLELIRQAAAASDTESVSRVAHKIKGTAANICVDGIMTVARDLERSAADNNGAKSETLIQQLAEEIERFDDFLEGPEFANLGAPQAP